MPPAHRDALLEAARTLLRTQGLAATTARDLVEESGTNLASIGYHYGGKDALLGAALAEVVREWTEQPVAAALGATGEPGESLAAAVRVMLTDLPGERPEILAFLDAVVAAGRGGAVGEHLAPASRRALDAVAASMTARAPGLPDELAAAGAAVVVAIHDGLALLSTIAPERVPDPETVLWVLAGFGAALAPVLGVTPELLAAVARGEVPVDAMDTDSTDGSGTPDAP